MKAKKLTSVLLSTILFLNISLSSVTVLANNSTTSDTTQTEYSEIDSSQSISKVEESFSIEESTSISEENLEITEYSEEEQASNRFTSPNPEIQQMIDALTENDLQNAVGADGLGEKQHDHEYSSPHTYSNRRYENVNNYIKKKNFKTPAIKKNVRYGTTPRYNYKIGKPIGVVVHETANPNSTIQSEINYMYNNYQNAFVHAFTDHNSIIETAPTDYLAWGAGPHANPYFMHIELVEVKTFDEFARSVNNDAYWIATQLKNYGLQPRLADRNNGVGSVISHNAVSKYYGGTNHTDPTGYFASWGYNMDQFFELIEYHYYGNNTGTKPAEPENYEIFDRDVSIKSNANFNIHSKPYPYKGFKVVGNTKDHQGKQVHVNMKSKTSVSTYYNVEGLGWIDSRAFTSGLDTVTKKNIKRHAKVHNSKRYSFYKEPYNTKGAYRLGPTTQPLFGQDVELTQQAIKTKNNETFYLVKGHGWVPADAFSLIYDEENIKNISKDVSVTSTTKNNIHSRPYPYYGFKVTGNAESIRGTQVHLSQEAKTSNGTYYLADGYGWIRSNAFTNGLDTLTKKKTTRHGKVSTTKRYNFYKEPHNTLGASRTGKISDEFAGQDLEIIEQGTNNRTKELFYLVKDEGWLPKAAFSLVYDEEDIKNISKDVSVTSTTKNNIHSRPYPYYGFKVTGNAEALRGTQVHLSQEAKTSNGTYYLADGYGWIRSNAFTSGLDTLTKKKISRYGKISTTKRYNFYKEPHNTLGASRTGKISDEFAGQDLEIIEQGTNNRTKELFYLVKDEGWLPKAAFSLVYDEENIKNISKDVSVKPTSKNNVHSRPYPYYGFKVTGKVTPYGGKQVHLSQEAETSNGTYYLADGIGWVRFNAFTDGLETANKTVFNRDAKVLTKTFDFYTEPYNTKNAEKNGKTTASLRSKDVILTHKAVTSKSKQVYYLVKNYGWVEEQALLIYDIPNYEKINISETILPNVSFNVHTEPYPYKGFKVIGTTASMKMNNKKFNIKRQAHTSNGIYYEVPGYGWVNKKAFSSDVEKYKQVQNLLDRKYSSSNFGIFVKSINSNSSAGVFPDTRFTAASTGKLPAIYYTQKRYNNKTLNPNTKYLYTDAINQMNESYGRGGAGILQNKPFGGMYTIDTILNWTIYYSDNQGANFLGYYAADKFSQPMKQEISQIIGRQWDSPFSITARENAKLMEAIYKQGGNANKYLQNTSFDNQRIPKYLPVKVGHKIGDVFDCRHDVAIVYAKEPYILSVMTKNYQSYETISQLSLEIYNILK